ncbi:hypothetical protein BM885_005205, partial [Escherichia coli]|nr:hypothetical protein [Escherichia coli]
LFGIALTDRNGAGIDGQVNGRSVQIKATGTGRGPAFRVVDARADHLIFLNIDFETLQGEVVFNGPEEIALKSLPTTWIGQRSLTRSQILAADKLVPTEDRLRRIDN